MPRHAIPCPDCGHLYDSEAEHVCPSTITDDWRADALALIEDATRFVTSERSGVYGRPKVNHERIAALWSAWLGQPITASDAAMCALLVKVARLMESPTHRDSIADLIGYALVYHDCVSDR